MTEKEITDTKEKILMVAGKLFAEKGFDGTSIRDIANEADVNLSAVNYHFQNKHNLYCQLFQMNYLKMENDLNALGSDPDLDTKEFSWKIYNYFIDNSTGFLNSYKLFIQAGVELPEEVFCNKSKGDFGPPGKDSILAVITKDVGADIPYEGRHWAMRMIFNNIVQSGVKMASPHFKEHAKKIPYFQPEEKKRTIYFLVDAILEYLKTHPENWK